MAILTSGNTFSTGQQVLATSLNAAVNNAAFAAGAIDVATMQFLGTNDQIGIKDLGVTAAKIANLTVTGAKIADATITPAKLSAGAPAWTATTLNVANSLDFALANSTATAGTYGRAVTTGLITVTMTAHGMVTGNVALLDFSENAGVAATDGSYAITRIDDNSFTVVDTAASPTAIAAGTVVSRTNYYGNATIRGSGSVTGNLSVTGSATVTGALSVTEGEVKPIVRATAQATTSGTTKDFTSIPSWVKRITVMLSGVSSSGVSSIVIRIGSTASGIESSGYLSHGGVIQGPSLASTDQLTGFVLSGDLNAASYVLSGSFTISNLSGNTWVFSGSARQATNRIIFGAGEKTITSGLLDRIRLTTVNGTDTFDAGSINIMYE